MRHLYIQNEYVTTLVVLQALKLLSDPNFLDYLYAAKYKKHWRGKAGAKAMTRGKVPL